MSQQGKETASSKDQKTKPVQKEITQEPGHDLATPSAITDNLLAAVGDPTANSHAALLGDARLLAIQRQAAAAKISKVGGNRYLTDVVAQMKERQANDVTPAGRQQPGQIQRENGDTTTKGGGEYEVQRGDTLWGIARDTYGHGRYWREIYRANPDKASDGGNLILIGVILTLPEIDVPAATTEAPGEAPEAVEPGAGPGTTPTPEEPTTTTEEAAPAAEPASGEGTGTGTGEATHPEVETNDFGSFVVYPDEFIGPLPLSERNADNWPIRQADFDALVTRLTEVKDGSSNIKVTGNEEFKTHVYLDLGWLMTAGIGQQLIQEIQAADHNVEIIETEGGNGAGYDPDADSWETTDTPPERGPGSNVTVHFNPNRLFIKDGSLDWHHRPPAIGLAHEMVHAWSGVYGMRARGEDEHGVRRREQQATGLADHADNALTENRFRAAFGLPLRPVY